MDVKYKLYSLEARGRVELIRFIFYAAGKSFDDIRIHQTIWDQLKWSTPLKTLPVLEFGDSQLGQSLSISRYLADVFDLGGRTNLEKAFVDEAADMIDEILTDTLKIQYEQSKNYKQHATKRFLSRTLPLKLKKLDQFKVDHGTSSGCIVGNHLTYADLAAYSTFDQLVTELITSWEFLEQYNYPHELHKRIFGGEERISKYLKNRHPTMNY